MTNRNGIVLYEGPSLIDGDPIVVLMTGLKNASGNRKTGGMVQTYILRADVPPTEALADGMDGSICGGCPHRSKASGGRGSCYVNVGHGPQAVWKCWKHGSGYIRGSLDVACGRLRASGRGLRVGTYGDPGAAPGEVWRRLVKAAPFHTGYTHRWRHRPDLIDICQASVDSAEQAEKAWSDGWSTFRVSRKGDALRLAGEARCPASEEAEKKVTCESCPVKCNGSQYRVRSGERVSIFGRVIQAHGAMASCYTGGE
jgi:hypothetical protein